MKRIAALILGIMMLLTCAVAEGNYTDEMKIPYGVDLSPDDGSDSVEREGDHVDSPYFSRLDFYNMESNDTFGK